jgi:hypothetical protein
MLAECALMCAHKTLQQFDMKAAGANGSLQAFCSVWPATDLAQLKQCAGHSPRSCNIGMQRGKDARYLSPTDAAALAATPW